MTTKKSPLQMVGIKQLSKVVKNIPSPTPGYTDEEAEKEFNRMKYITDAAIKKGAGAVITVPKKSNSPASRLDKGKGLISSEQALESGAYRKSALNMLGISRKSSPLNDMAGGLTHEEMYKKSPENLKGHKENREVHKRQGVSRKSSPLNEGDPTGMQDPSLLQENTTGSGNPWSQYTEEDVLANTGSGKPLPTQMFQGTKVNPNINDAWQTDKQAQETEDLENTDN